MKSCGVAIQMKPLSQFLNTVPSKPTPWRVNNFPREEGVKGQIFKIRMRPYFTGRCRVPWRGVTGRTSKTALGGGGVHVYFLE